jgi:hypothetical protein
MPHDMQNCRLWQHIPTPLALGSIYEKDAATFIT